VWAWGPGQRGPGDPHRQHPGRIQHVFPRL